ncbi:FAD-binding oxidoreductase [Paraburkholderia edwinii]|uniref:FAD-binding oxidoreductase n=1 Tax=Paraburkholderia edwinii TaxID=2861782 RepID=A0ABX8UPL5_9BURK|nr:FAD-binding oxidoreductase [Paraburkholderia edwinii]QYD70937.1 FAD-binding oxidoreductase [Paraburkholderia edwinii]
MNASKLQSWGRYPYAHQSGEALAWRDVIQPRLADAHARLGTTLAFGNGRSYGDSCLADTGQVLPMKCLARFISADWTNGVVRAEAGITLGELLTVSLPHGWMLPVTPGTQFATLGGAVANDVHGKNHHVRGTFGRHVRRFSLLRSDRPAIECSLNEETALFRATIGGLGLTGVIEWVEIQLMPVRSSHIAVSRTRYANLDEFLALARDQEAIHEYGVAWVDCLARGGALGRGIYTSGDHTDDGDFSFPAKRACSVPFVLPFSPVSRTTVRAFNALYYRRQKPGIELARMAPTSFFYPLDNIHNWNRIYGRHGFQQHQCVVPAANACDALHAILHTIARNGSGSFLAVLKRCGPLPSPGLLSFPMEGVSLALDFPQNEQRNTELFARLDSIVAEAGGRQYPAKDAHMSGEHFRAAYPAWQELERHRDPALMSRFWKRTTQS